jgi:hypothetical protein
MIAVKHLRPRDQKKMFVRVGGKLPKLGWETTQDEEYVARPVSLAWPA